MVNDVLQRGFQLNVVRNWRMFLKTPEDFLGPKAILKIQFFSSGDEVFSPQTSAAFFVNFGFFFA